MGVRGAPDIPSARTHGRERIESIGALRVGSGKPAHSAPLATFRRWGLKLAGEGKNKKLKRRAVVAVARKLAVVMHRLWVTGEQFVAFPQGQPKTIAA